MLLVILAGVVVVDVILDVQVTGSLETYTSAGDVGVVSLPPAPVALAAAENDCSTGLLDVIYTYVDGNNSRWSDKFQAFATQEGPQKQRLLLFDGANRFADHGELMFSLRSVAMHWQDWETYVRRVIVVTDSQHPGFVRRDAADVVPPLHVVDHREIWRDPRHLPVFNSFAIESQILQMENLSSVFVLSNDDMFWGKSIDPRQLWSPTAGPFFFLEQHLWAEFAHATRAPHVSELSAVAVASKILDHAFVWRARPYLAHAPRVIVRDVAREMVARFQKEIGDCGGHRFRDASDVHIPFLAVMFHMERFGEEVARCAGVANSADAAVSQWLTERAVPHIWQDKMRIAILTRPMSLESFARIRHDCRGAAAYVYHTQAEGGSEPVTWDLLMVSYPPAPNFPGRLSEAFGATIFCLNDDTGGLASNAQLWESLIGARLWQLLPVSSLWETTFSAAAGHGNDGSHDAHA